MTFAPLVRRLKYPVIAPEIHVRTAEGALRHATLTIHGPETGGPTGTVVGIDYLVVSALSTFPLHVRGSTSPATI